MYGSNRFSQVATRRLLVLPFLTLMGWLVLGCEGPTMLPLTPNIHRDGSGSQVLAQLPPDQRIVDMPVLYVTDRHPIVEPKIGARYGVQRSPSLAFGEATVSLDPKPTWEELARASGSAPGRRRYGLIVSKIEEKGKVIVGPASMEAYEGGLRFRPEEWKMITREGQKFIDLMRARLAATDRKDVYLYIHGVNNTFEDAISRASIIWHYTGRQGVMMAYAWPAGMGGPLGYFYDRESGEYTVMHLKRLLVAITECPEVERIHLIAHSRGCDVTITALRELNISYQAMGRNTQKELKLETLVLAAPDVDVEVFGLRVTIENMAVIAKRLVVYSSAKDELVGISDWLFHSRARLGTLSKSDIFEPAQVLLALVPNVQLVQCFVFGFGTTHDYVFTNPGAMSDLILVLRDRKDPGVANGRPLNPLGGAFWKLDNNYALPEAKKTAVP